MKSLVLAGALALLSGCASIPPEAPELSAQLGTRITAIESAHRRLLADFFTEKRRQVDRFVEETWAPHFARELFADPRVSGVWDQVVESGSAEDRQKFLGMVGPRIQAKINSRRLTLIQPLDELEQEIALKLKSEYDQMRAINNTLTSFLQSAAKVEENRRRYLELVGVTDAKIDSAIGQAGTAVSNLLNTAESVEARADEVLRFRDEIRNIISRLRQPATP